MASTNVDKVITAIHQRGLANPSGAQLLALGRRAVLAAMVNTPLTREFERLSKADWANFKHFTASWASAIERHVGAKKHEDAA